jgi:hypothetical protein
MAGSRRLFAALLSLPLGGCGATTLRFSVGPTADTDRRVGFEAGASLGIGTPTDFSSRSHHYFQGLLSSGGGYDGKFGFVSFGAGVDYIYWAEPRFLVRAGIPLTLRFAPAEDEDPLHLGIGGHFALLPAVKASGGGPMVGLFCLGPDLRVERIGGNGNDPARARFSLPFIAEVDLFAAGD